MSKPASRRTPAILPTRLLLIMLATAVSMPGTACDLCAIYSASQAQGESGKGPFAGVAEQYTHFGTLLLEGHEFPNPAHQRLDSSISQLFAGYNFHDRFGLQFNLPFIYRDFRRPQSSGRIENGTETGIGDTSLLANGVVFSRDRKNSTLRLSLFAGVKFPTGDSGRLAEEFPEDESGAGPASGIHGHDLALGSGSFDGVGGGVVFARYRTVFLNATVQYALRSQGDYGYRYADDLTWAGGPGAYILLRDEYTLSAQAVVSGEYKRFDTLHGRIMQDTALTAVYMGFQLNFTWSEKLSMQAGLDLPVSIDVSDLQAAPDYRIRLRATYRF